ncbi:MAG: thioredoxin-dependent thiol peroxidase [Candidatus Heimdallarchaeota archaeon]|nr:thioredoxin-dependent thiol peroxidase [Candidatus Heimdallarchaeota archaeon]
MLKEGDLAPQFCLLNESNEKICLKDFLGKWVVLYFYPKDNTPGCTTEACDFTASFDDFKDLDATIVGVSPDSPERHMKFIKKYMLKHILLSDGDHEVLLLYGVWKEKAIYGKSFLGVIRSTFMIDPTGKIAKIWPKVKVKGHAEEVKEVLDKLQS